MIEPIRITESLAPLAAGRWGKRESIPRRADGSVLCVLKANATDLDDLKYTLIVEVSKDNGQTWHHRASVTVDHALVAPHKRASMGRMRYLIDEPHAMYRVRRDVEAPLLSSLLTSVVGVDIEYEDDRQSVRLLAASYVQGNSAQGSGTSVAVSFPGPVTTGSMVKVDGRGNDEQQSATAFTDNQSGNTYVDTQRFVRAPGSMNAVFGHALAVNSNGGTFTVTMHLDGGTDNEIGIAEYTGIAAVSSYDSAASVGATDGGADPKTTGAAANANAQADSILILSAVSHVQGFATWSPDTGWSEDVDGVDLAIMHRNVLTSQVNTGTLNSGTSDNVDIRLDVYKSALAATGNPWFAYAQQ